jgi:hypothetical protein
VDNLEKRLLDALIFEEREEFNDVAEIKEFLKELEQPFKDVKRFGMYWKKRVPKAIQETWMELPVSTRFLVWSMSFGNR